MSVIINQVCNRWVTASRTVVEDTRLSMRDRGLLITLISLPPKWHYTAAGLSKILPDGKDAVNAGIKRLEKFGYIKCTQIRKKGKFAYNQLEVFDTPLRENPFTEKPSTGKSSADFPAQLNNNILNTNELNTEGCTVSTGKDKRHGDKGNRRKTKDNDIGHGWTSAERDLYGI